ncbi:hypothetical protein FDI24_gp164 [Acidovorax phage ACP17]|uniref:Uncharacterized protein n=1 Tax=Acidovorax phage ACP17 TaxID=2010329 RepID=A0A218M329_9CAUD|nr:hypothetical protein FDI24_gp164 [Acidovorax phage ACP17]ASD50446.1 hypothetical protein [Acidovorax phage ACP17]
MTYETAASAYDEDADTLLRLLDSIEQIVSGETVTSSDRLYDRSIRPRKMTIRDAQAKLEPMVSTLRSIVVRMRAATPRPQADAVAPFQERVQLWMMACFGAEISADLGERNLRFLEEALELVQSCGCSVDEAHQMVDYVFNRPIGEPSQEVGGVMVTLAALCLANSLDMHTASETELSRIWTKVEVIRAKQASKPVPVRSRTAGRI